MTYSLFTGVSGPGASTSFSGGFIGGIAFEVTAPGQYLYGYRLWRADSAQADSADFALWEITRNLGGTVVPSSSASGSAFTAGAWNTAMLGTPLALTQSTAYEAQYGLTGNFPYTASQFGSGDPYSAGITSGPLYGYCDQGGSGTAVPFSNPQGAYVTGSADPTALFVDGASLSFNAWIDLIVGPAAVSSPGLLPACFP